MLDIYFTKTAANTWEVAVYNQADAAPGTPLPLCAPARSADRRRSPSTPTTGALTSASAAGITIAGARTAPTFDHRPRRR